MGNAKEEMSWFTAFRKVGTTDDWKPITNKEGSYFADPFLCDKWCFVEEMDGVKGVISVIDLETMETQKVLERDYHLSYPFILEDGDSIYMVPETGANHKIELYRAVDFPHKWEFVKVLVDGITAGDTNIYKIGDSYYLFTTNGNDNKLWIMKSHSLFSDWSLVKEELIENSRSAGNIYEEDGKLIRPVQDCSDSYGKAIIFKEITIEPYSEKVVGRIEPDWYRGLKGTHTFNRNDKYEVIDGKL